jgi:four helix bundle suffix protein
MSYPTYKNLISYRQAVIICDITVEFCKKYVSFKSRTVDQMEQAARSGKQNIVEGCAASKHNPQTEIKLLGVARASFEELLEDYLDFLRQHGLSIWAKDDPRALAIRNLYKTHRSDMSDRSNKSDMTQKTHMPNRSNMSHKSDMAHKTNKSYETHTTYKTDKTYATYTTDRTYTTNNTNKTYPTDTTDRTYETYKSYMNEPEKIANAMITLINQTNYLLDKQIAGVKEANSSKGVIWEPQNQKVSRVLREDLEKDKKFDDWAKGELERLRLEDKSNRSDRSDKTNMTSLTNKKAGAGLENNET